MFSARTKQGPHLCPSGTAPPPTPSLSPLLGGSFPEATPRACGEGTPASVLQGDAARLWAPAGDTKHGRPRKGGEERKPPSGTRRRVPAVTPPAPRARPPSGPLQAVTRALCTLPSEEARRPPAPQAPDASLAAWHPGGKATTSPPAPV